MIGFGVSRKIFLPVVGLLTGILLFLASFSMLLNGIFYNSEFQKEAFNALGIYNSVTKLAETLSPEISIPQDQIVTIVKNSITPDLVSLNVQSLIDGLINYFKGYTESLPDLQLAASVVSSTSAITTSSAQSLAGLQKINLRVLFMVFGEQHATDIILVISLLQFILTYIPLFGLMIFLTVFVMIIQKTPLEIRAWILSTVASYFILCLAAGSLIQLALYLKLPYLLSLIDKLEPISEGILSRYITYCANTLSVRIILSGTILFAAIQAAILLWERTCQNAFSDACSLSCSFNPSFICMTTTDNAHDARFIRKTSIIILSLIALSSIGFYAQIRAASQNFDNRNLGRAVSILKGNDNDYQVIDAKNDQVYLLNVKVLDNITQLPVQDLMVSVAAKDKSGVQSIQSTTDSEGSAVFLLDKGSFQLVLDYVSPPANYNIPKSLSYEFEMTKPGKAELTVLLCRQTNNLSFITKATMQYIP